MISYQLFKFLIYLFFILLVIDFSKIYLSLFLMSLFFYLITYRKPYSNREYENLYKNLTEESRLNDPPYKFTWDGCSALSALLELLNMSNAPFEKECFIHDYAYWKGGPYNLRKEADLRLYNYLIDNNYNSLLSKIIYYTIRIFASSNMPFPWRWGYGYKY